jgi:hypothetical protein
MSAFEFCSMNLFCAFLSLRFKTSFAQVIFRYVLVGNIVHALVAFINSNYLTRLKTLEQGNIRALASLVIYSFTRNDCVFWTRFCYCQRGSC